MSHALTPPKGYPTLSFRLTLRLGLVMLVVGLIFTAIYFVLSLSFFSRLANEQMLQRAKSATTIIEATLNAKNGINSRTFIRQIQTAKLSDNIAVFDAKHNLIDHSVEKISKALERYATDTKLRLREVEEEKTMLKNVLRAKTQKRLEDGMYVAGKVRYTVFEHKDYVILVGFTPQLPNMLTLGVSFLLLCLIAIAINALFVYQYSHSLSTVLLRIIRGLEVDSVHPEGFHPAYAEIADLLKAVEEKVGQSSSTRKNMEIPYSKTNEPSEGLLAVLQNKLFEKPFPRMQRYELAVYPRRPKLNTKEFICGSYSTGRVDVFIGITDSDLAGALVEKNRIQERFWALAEQETTSQGMAQKLWNALFAASEFVPGIFFARLDETHKTMDIYRAGGVHLFEISRNECKAIELGSSQFESSFTSIATHSLVEGSQFVMVSHDAFRAMELSTVDFAQMLEKLSDGKKGKHLLAGILEKIHQKLDAGETVPGLLAVLSEK
ncbi:MAG: hypothetical protein LDLANPLL_00390 [Turneriella sp.]|nr:hypothetical protein [Turneriella sp.]